MSERESNVLYGAIIFNVGYAYAGSGVSWEALFHIVVTGFITFAIVGLYSLFASMIREHIESEKS